MEYKIKLIKDCLSIENIRILNMLPTNIKEISKSLNLTKMPTNRRVNQLEKYNLLIRDRKSHIIKKSIYTNNFLNLINSFTIGEKDE